MNSGYFILQNIDGAKPDTGAKTQGYVKAKELVKIEPRKSVIYESIHM